MTDLGSLGPDDTWAKAINDSDEVTGESYTVSDDIHAFRWKNGVMTDEGTLGGVLSRGFAINNSGIIVGEAEVESTLPYAGYQSLNGSMQNLKIDPTNRVSAEGINDPGQITGWKVLPDGNKAGWLLDNGLTFLGSLGGGSTTPTDINDIGQIVGWSYTSTLIPRAFIWENGVMTDLGGVPPGNYSYANSINSSGEIVGNPAFIYKDGEMKKLNDLIDPASGWNLVEATCINDNGWIVGNGIINGQLRAFLLIPNKLKITSPEINEVFVTMEDDTIKWTGGRPDQSLKISISSDSGSTYNETHFQIPAEPGEFVWTPASDYLSKKCLIKIVDMNDSTNADTSDAFHIKPYIITRDSSGEYETYKPGEDQWGFGNTQDDMFPPSWYQQFNYQGIDPFTGIQYSQWQAEFTFATSLSEEFVDWVSWVNAFSADFCYFSITLGLYKPSGVFTWDAVKWLPWKGSCYGIALSNALAFQAKDQFLSEYQEFPAFSNPISVTSNDGVKTVVNELMTYQFSTQNLNYFKNIGKLKTPSQTLDDIKEMLNDDVTEIRTMSFHNNNGTGAHAVIAYGLQKDFTNPNIYYVKVYDSNFPNQPVTITINSSTNNGNGSWGYPEYPGWSGNKWIYLNRPAIEEKNNSQMGKHNIILHSPFRLNENELQIFNSDSTSIRIIDVLGNVTGFYNNMVLTDIPESTPFLIYDGNETPPIGYSFQTDNYSVILNEFGDEKVNTSFFTGNRIFSYKRSGAEANQTDRLFFDGGVSVINPDAVTKTIKLANVINENTQEKLTVVRLIELAQNDSVKIENPDSNKVKLVSYGTAKDYDIELNYVTENGIGRFGSYGVALFSNTSHTFIPDWINLSNSQLMVFVDFGNNGTIDDTLYLNNTVGVEDQGSLLSPNNYNLVQNYPNPFNPITTIQYSIPQRSNVTLKVYDILGNEIATLVNEEKERGVYTATFDARGFASGVYFYTLTAGNFIDIKKMILMK
jgi:probable HAF family extracellular repeat protein